MGMKSSVFSVTMKREACSNNHEKAEVLRHDQDRRDGRFRCASQTWQHVSDEWKLRITDPLIGTFKGVNRKHPPSLTCTHYAGKDGLLTLYSSQKKIHNDKVTFGAKYS